MGAHTHFDQFNTSCDLSGGVFILLAVLDLVNFQSVWTSESFFANLTDVWFLTTMLHPMARQIVL